MWRFSLSLSLFVFSHSLLASLDLFHLIGLALCQVTWREGEKWKKEKKGTKKINNSPKSTFFLLSTTWWTQVIRRKERKKRLKSFHNYACVSYNQGQSAERIHVQPGWWFNFIYSISLDDHFLLLLASLFHLWLLFLLVFSHVYNHIILFYTPTHTHIVILLCLLSSPADSCLV